MEINLTSKQICDILKACEKAGVGEFSFGELKVSFLPKKTAEVVTNIDVESYNKLVEADTQVATNFKIPKEEIEELENAQMMIDDPLAFEQGMIDGQLFQGNVNEHN